MKKKPTTALVPTRTGELGQRPPGAPPRPIDVFRGSCTPESRPTMVARLDAAARILRPGSDADTFPWEVLDHLAVTGVLAAMREAGASTATVNLTRAALRKMAKVLFGMRLLDVEERLRIDDVSPAKGKRLPRGRSLTEREVRKLFAACAKDPTPAGRRDAALVAVLYGGGLRRAEAASLDLSDFTGTSLRVEGKGRRQRIQPIGEDAARAVQAWIAVRGSWAGPLFVVINRHGSIIRRRLRGSAIRWKAVVLARRSGLEPVRDGRGRHLLSPHDLRRTFVTTLLEAGEDLATASKAAGHSSVAVTAIYDKRDEKAVAAAVAKLPVPFRG